MVSPLGFWCIHTQYDQMMRWHQQVDMEDKEKDHHPYKSNQENTSTATERRTRTN
jgi:hypothetical protein